MADSNYLTEVDHILAGYDADDYLITEDLETVSNSNVLELVDASSKDFLFDLEPVEIVTGELIEGNPNTNQDFLLNLESVATVNDELTGSDLNTGVALFGTNDNLGVYYSYGSTIWGTPNLDSQYWRQQEGSMACAVVAQISVYESITGQYISESAAAEYAENQGWFDPETGTPLTYSDNILNALGVETEQYYDADMTDIAIAMNNGDKVIVAIDGSEIWNPIYNTVTGYPNEQPDAGHAVWVTGIEQHADKTIDFILNDSGWSGGQMEAVDYWDFMNAWDDYDNFLTIVDA